MTPAGGERLFSYGTLRLEAVQRAVFGGPVHGFADAVVGHRLDDVTLTAPDVVALSGSAVHPMLVPTQDGSGEVPGTVFILDCAQLAAADAYEVDAYVRVEVPLRSGGTAWVYRLR